jgi:hypothetical protein
MNYVKVTDPSTVNKLFRLGRIQETVLAFHADEDCKVARVIIQPGEYKNGIRTAQNSYSQTIKKLGFSNIKARVLDGDLYLIKVEE